MPAPNKSNRTPGASPKSTTTITANISEDNQQHDSLVQHPTPPQPRIQPVYDNDYEYRYDEAYNDDEHDVAGYRGDNTSNNDVEHSQFNRQQQRASVPPRLHKRNDSIENGGGEDWGSPTSIRTSSANGDSHYDGENEQSYDDNSFEFKPHQRRVISAAGMYKEYDDEVRRTNSRASLARRSGSTVGRRSAGPRSRPDPSALSNRPHSRASSSQDRRPSSAPGTRGRKVREELQTTLSQKSQVALDLTGISIPSDDDEPVISVEDFDENDGDASVIISSPRSVEALLRTGITAKELIHRPYESFADRTISAQIQKFRYDHYEQKRLEKLELVRAERMKIMEEEEQKMQEATSEERSSMIERERLRLEKALRQNRAHMEQLLEYERRMKQRAEENAARLEAQRKRDEYEKMMKQKEAQQREQERLQKQKEHKEMTNRILREQEELVEAKKREMEEKEALRRQQMEEQRQMIALVHEEQRRRNMQRVEAARQQYARLLELQRENFNKKQQEVERRRKEFEEKRLNQQREQRRKAEEKAAKIQATQARNHQLEMERIQRAHEREAQAEERKRQLDEIKEKMNQEKRRLEEEKEAKRIGTFLKAKEEQEHKVEMLLEKQAHAEMVLQQTKAEKERRQQLLMEERRLKELDKKEYVERMRRKQEYQKLKTMQKLQDKTEKCYKLEREKQMLIEQKRRDRELLERSKVHPAKREPGPGDYEAEKVIKIGDAPAFKFGISAEAQKPRVLSHEHAKEWFGRWSPGPCAYNTTKTKPEAPSFSFGTAPRFSGPGDLVKIAAKMPGPGAYTPNINATSNDAKLQEERVKQNLIRARGTLRSHSPAPARGSSAPSGRFSSAS